MGRKSNVKDWLKNDPAQMAWAIRYLSARGWRHEADMLQHRYEAGVGALEKANENLAGEKLVRNMRNAWKKSQNNKNGARPSVSHTLDRGAAAQLQRLADQLGQTKSETLEQLIRRGFAFEAEEREVRRKALEEERKAWREKKPMPLPSPQEKMLAAKVADLKKELEKRQELMTAFLLQYAEREVLQGPPPPSGNLDQRQIEAVLKRRDALLAYHDVKLKAAMAWGGIEDPKPELSDIPATELKAQEEGSNEASGHVAADHAGAPAAKETSGN